MSTSSLHIAAYSLSFTTVNGQTTSASTMAWECTLSTKSILYSRSPPTGSDATLVYRMSDALILTEARKASIVLCLLKPRWELSWYSHARPEPQALETQFMSMPQGLFYESMIAVIFADNKLTPSSTA